MSQAPEHTANDALDPFRVRAFKDRRQLINSLGPETYDQGHVLYPCPSCGHPVVVVDAFPGVAVEGPVEAFIEGLARGWWSARDTLQSVKCDACGHEGPVAAAAGLYCRFLPSSGFDWAVELGPVEGDAGGPRCCWRVDARGQAVQLDLPESSLLFRDQTGSFFDLRVGWRALVEGAVSSESTVAVEVQPGYIIGARPGDPSHADPASREDETLESLFGLSARRRYDTLEFLGRADDPLEILSTEEGVGAWLGEHAPAVAAGTLELFALADAHRMLAAVEELAEVYTLTMTSQMVGDDLEEGGVQLRFEGGPAGPRQVYQVQTFDAAYLRTLHSGMTFEEGAAAWFGPAIRAVAEARDLVAALARALPRCTLTVDEGAVLVVQGPNGDQRRWPLMTLIGRVGALEGGAASTAAQLLSLLGYDAEAEAFRPATLSLDVCPVTGAPARVGKIIRPLEMLGVDPRTLAGVPIGKHLVVYTLESATHTTPLEADPSRALATLEQAYQRGLPHAHLPLVSLRRVPQPDEPERAEPWLLVAADAGSLVLEPGRIRQALAAAGVDEDEIAALDHAYGFFPDALVLTAGPSSPQALRALRRSAHETLRAAFPGRDWPLSVARPVDLKVAPVGSSAVV